MKRKYLKTKKGYTIIETMIAVSLFVVVVTVGIDALLNANVVHQKSQDIRSTIDNLSFIMEDMSRNIRTGYDYRCFPSGQGFTPGQLLTSGAPRSCANGWALAFEATGGNPSTLADQWLYYIDIAGKLYKSTDGAITFVQLTPDEVKINLVSGIYSSFSVLGAEPPGDSQQPFVIIRLVGEIFYKGVSTPFSLQTSVSQRLVDI